MRVIGVHDLAKRSARRRRMSERRAANHPGVNKKRGKFSPPSKRRVLGLNSKLSVKLLLLLEEGLKLARLTEGHVAFQSHADLTVSAMSSNYLTFWGSKVIPAGHDICPWG